MNANASPSYAKKLQAKGKSPGWAAFDLKQRQKQGLPQVGNDPFPPLPTTSTTSFRPCGNPPSNNGYFEGAYSSVLLPSADFPSIAEDSNCNKYTRVSDYGQVEVIEEKKPAFVLNHLKELHSWADKSLIEDVMAAVNGDIDKATVFLEEIISTDNSEENGEAKYFSNCDDFQCDTEEDESVLLGRNSDLAADIADLSSTLEDALKGNYKQSKNVHSACGHRLSEAAAANMKLILGHIRSFPVEPEWEEHDVYLSHRRNALRMMRLAARHSRAATNAFLRGDHFSAQQNSLKARKEWLNAERLNAKAAKEILSIRNSENNPWKLDLHGLHAAEAVKALQEHLNTIETLLLKDRPVSPGRFKTKNGIVSSSLKPFISIDMENLDKQQAGLRHRTVSLQVITGIGNHSRGQAAIPTAVRSFLSENGAPVLSTRGTAKASIPAASDDISSRSSWKAYNNGELSQKIDLNGNSSFGVAAPILKSFMQVGSRFGESTLKLGSILTDGQVGIFKDRSAAAMSTFGDILPAQAAGLLSSFTATRSDS